MKKLKTLLFILFLLIYSAGYGDAAALYSIANPRFSGYVDRDDNYRAVNLAVDRKISRGVLRDGLLYFSVTLIGSVQTFEYLEEHRHLEVEVIIWADGKQKDSVQIGMTTRNWDEERSRLKYELDNMGFFTWRTYMNTKKIWYSEIELVLRDDNKHFVAPIGYSGSYRAKIVLIP